MDPQELVDLLVIKDRQGQLVLQAHMEQQEQLGRLAPQVQLDLRDPQG